MFRKILMFSISFFVLSLIALPVLAETTTTDIVTSAPVVTTSAKIVCVANAVSVRETAIGVAVAAHSDAIKAAYATRVNELAGAYSNTNVKAVQAGVRVSWADFNKSVKSASNTWKTSRNNIWSAFRVSLKSCKAPAGVSDGAHSGSEVSGQ